ncbi:MAG: outer membrane protein LapE, partial [Rhodospirillaceae bacterium]
QDRRVNAELEFSKAISTFQAVFNRDPGDFSTMRLPPIPRDALPPTLEEAIAIAETTNPQLKGVMLEDTLSRERVKAARAGFFPKVELVADHKRKQNASGTLGARTETAVKAQVSWLFNTGLTAVNTLKAAELAVDATRQRYTEVKDSVIQPLRNSWNSYIQSQKLAELRHYQANLAGEFLDLARRERQLGTRSLLDVLKGETDHNQRAERSPRRRGGRDHRRVRHPVLYGAPGLGTSCPTFLRATDRTPFFAGETGARRAAGRSQAVRKNILPFLSPTRGTDGHSPATGILCQGRAGPRGMAASGQPPR